MITGLLSVTSGDTQIMTKSVKDELDDIRERCNIGFCQQKDTLNHKLTVWEHLKLVASLKNVKDLESEIDSAMQALNI